LNREPPAFGITMGGNRSARGIGPQARKNKFRPQDPFSARQPDEDRGHNQPPKDEEDVVLSKHHRFRDLVAEEPMPSVSAASSGAPAGSKRARKKHTRRATSGTPREAAAAARGDVVSTGHCKGENLQNKRPGLHTAGSDRRVREELAEASCKTSSKRRREKNRARQEAKRRAAKQNSAGAVSEDGDGSVGDAPPAAFGEVVQRPPSFSVAAVKSQVKLKAAVGSVRSVPGQASGKDDLAEYVAKVREAYAAVKKRRLSGRC